ncbi:glycosyl transferase GT4 family protein [Methanobrevibacter sp. 87.7]|uniref:glycosyltransferase n=1 Tax=Methanobrevibacter sp. 87.7 TaxID=387957 RepID=UPI000B512325|nr:glycosyltransferase [Methanobrevibacter sp. 87.7]OWT33191.1 glycosyl transferase GT4 family protein [Methanobrevibacter sp. 87.7]
MNILHVVPSFVPCFAAGGVVNASYQIAKKQVELGHNVTIYTTDTCINRLKFENNYNVNQDGIHVYYFKNISNSFKNKFTIDTPCGLKKHLKENIGNFDIIHIHEHRHSLAILTHKYAMKNNIPYIIQSHGSVLPFFQKETIKNIFDKIWGFNILHDASKAFALTPIEKEQYLKMGIKEENIKIIPLGINLEEYNNLPEKNQFRSKYNINNEKLLIFIGRLNKIKGLDLLIKSFNDFLNNTKEKVKLAIIGPDNGFENEIKKLIKEYDLSDEIILTGPLYKKEKLEALVDCDAFIMPSQYESFTTSGLEAMAASKPLILTECNHIATWVNNNCGLSCKYDIKSLSNTISKLLSNKELMETYGENGRKLIEEKYNWNNIINEIMKIYTETINENTS